ncbi:MAG: hypothetical protein F6J86_32180 [Symploca sp. SIO1B1]|nr:hypothetical protein [Symploca sp. SIO1B1]
MQHSQLNSELITQLLHIPKFGRGIGLHRMDYLLNQERIASWLYQIDAIKVTGSNGKGSVCHMVAAILKEAGWRVGLYTSPHLFHFQERIRVDGIDISDHDLQIVGQWVLNTIEEYQQCYPNDQCGAFEAFTAMALHHFATCQVDALVTEAGIGGRFDSTRMIPGRTTAITSLDLEHTEILGSTLELIAHDKADLCPSGGRLVVGEIDSEVLRKLEVYCALRKVHLLSISNCCTFSKPRYLDSQLVFDMQYRDLNLEDLHLKLLGTHQVNNAVVAIVLAEDWLRLKQPHLSNVELESIVRSALAHVSVLGRLQKVWEQPEIYVDVGHSPDAMKQLVASVQQLWPSEPVLLVTGVSYNKDIQNILAKLALIPHRAICTRAWHRGSQVQTVADCLASLRPDLPIDTAATIEQAVVMAKDLAIRYQMKVLVAGGLFLCAEFIRALQGEDPRRIQFL